MGLLPACTIAAEQLPAIGNYSHNPMLDITNSVISSTSDSTGGDGEQHERQLGSGDEVNPGTVTITAMSGGAQGAASVTVQ